MHQYSELSVGHVGRDCATLCGSVCRQCVERLRRELRNLLDLYRESDHALAPAHARLRQRVSGTRAVGTVLDERTVAMRTETAEVLASWARLVVEERGARGLRDCDVESLVEFLCGQLEWLAGHPAAVSFDDEVRGLLRRIGSALGPRPRAGVRSERAWSPAARARCSPWCGRPERCPPGRTGSPAMRGTRCRRVSGWRWRAGWRGDRCDDFSAQNRLDRTGRAGHGRQ